MKSFLAAAVTILLLSAAPAATTQMGSQSGSLSPQSSQSAHVPFGSSNHDQEGGLSPEARERFERSRQSDRQKRLIADTDHLLALANELKADMDKTTKDTLSIDVIKKADEIEKLAHNVKERMKG
jgi:hypothetical protein